MLIKCDRVFAKAADVVRLLTTSFLMICFFSEAFKFIKFCIDDLFISLTMAKFTIIGPSGTEANAFAVGYTPFTSLLSASHNIFLLVFFPIFQFLVTFCEYSWYIFNICDLSSSRFSVGYDLKEQCIYLYG